jgi:hypothetical protein
MQVVTVANRLSAPVGVEVDQRDAEVRPLLAAEVDAPWIDPADKSIAEHIVPLPALPARPFFTGVRGVWRANPRRLRKRHPISPGIPRFG